MRVGTCCVHPAPYLHKTTLRQMETHTHTHSHCALLVCLGPPTVFMMPSLHEYGVQKATSETVGDQSRARDKHAPKHSADTRARSYLSPSAGSSSSFVLVFFLFTIYFVRSIYSYIDPSIYLSIHINFYLSFFRSFFFPLRTQKHICMCVSSATPT